MKAFGIEIRKANSLSGLYADVDRVLSAAGIQSGLVTSEMQTQTVAHALQKMIATNRYFDICTIDRCIDISRIVVSKERYEVYRACHCMDYSEMMPEFRQNLLAMVMDDFRPILYPQSK